MDGETHIAVNAEALDQHLLFHKALIDDADDAEKIDRYRALLADSTEGERMLDPVDESIRAAFSLVLEHDMDPWAINLEEFVKVYGKRVQNSEFDMIVAGKLMLMAWRILRMQSDAAVISSEEPQEIEGFDEGFDGFEFEDEGEQLYIPQVRFDPVIYRNAVRPVTVMVLWSGHVLVQFSQMDFGISGDDICLSVVEQQRQIVIEPLYLASVPRTLKIGCPEKIGFVHVVG